MSTRARKVRPSSRFTSRRAASRVTGAQPLMFSGRKYLKLNLPFKLHPGFGEPQCLEQMLRSIPPSSTGFLIMLRLLLEGAEPELSINRCCILRVPRLITARKQLVQIQMRAHRAGQPEGCDGGVEVADQALRGTPAEVSVDGVKYWPQVFPEDLVGPGQFKAGDIQEPHQFRMLRYILYHKGGQHGDDDVRITVARQAALQFAPEFQAIQP